MNAALADYTPSTPRAILDAIQAAATKRGRKLAKWLVRHHQPDWLLTNTPFAQWPKRRLSPGERIAEVNTWVSVPPRFDDGWYDAGGESLAEVASQVA